MPQDRTYSSNVTLLTADTTASLVQWITEFVSWPKLLGRKTGPSCGLPLGTGFLQDSGDWARGVCRPETKILSYKFVLVKLVLTQ